ncbi:hypothetical protein CC80DRAFT_541237 [Byssothecium circinans]|uniref:Uncharacterized protein n=1 Tax=Byssothecium circinans TaxID=147558 RepID=A0A6A5UK53_9PLEO|nr:hypothetical protein CC80DRAFT_541237 [Byssothecium circinans]
MTSTRAFIEMHRASALEATAGQRWIQVDQDLCIRMGNKALLKRRSRAASGALQGLRGLWLFKVFKRRDRARGSASWSSKWAWRRAISTDTPPLGAGSHRDGNGASAAAGIAMETAPPGTHEAMAVQTVQTVQLDRTCVDTSGGSGVHGPPCTSDPCLLLWQRVDDMWNPSGSSPNSSALSFLRSTLLRPQEGPLPLKAVAGWVVGRLLDTFTPGQLHLGLLHLSLSLSTTPTPTSAAGRQSSPEQPPPPQPTLEATNGEHLQSELAFSISMLIASIPSTLPTESSAPSFSQTTKTP